MLSPRYINTVTTSIQQLETKENDGATTTCPKKKRNEGNGEATKR
jgi:hypothetical protein